MDPKPPQKRFAQCSTCRDWVSGDRRCVIHGPKVQVFGGDSCGLYVWGTPRPPGTETEVIVRPEESGFVERQVRCENCKWFDGDDEECELYRILNAANDDIFDLDTKVDAHGCCNAQTPGD